MEISTINPRSADTAVQKYLICMMKLRVLQIHAINQYLKSSYENAKYEPDIEDHFIRKSLSIYIPVATVKIE